MTIEFHSVSFAYQAGAPVLHNISFHARAGQFLLIIGQNGAGKSTLLKLLNGILKPTSGRVIVGDFDTSRTSIATMAGQVCVTFQNPSDQLFASTVRSEIEFAPRNLKRPSPDALATEALSLCELQHVASSHPYDLPFAQRRLLTIASAIASGSPFLAFDEPSAGISQLEQRTLSNLIARLRARERGFVVVSHDLEMFLPYADTVLVLGAGRVAFIGGPKQLVAQESILRHAGLRLPMTIRLLKMQGLESMPKVGGDLG